MAISSGLCYIPLQYESLAVYRKRYQILINKVLYK
jgi:hypothetical protein